MSNGNFIGFKLKGKVTIVDAAELAEKEQCVENGVKGVQNEQESDVDTSEPEGGVEVAGGKSTPPAKSGRSLKKRKYNKKREHDKKSGPFGDTDEADIAKIKEKYLKRYYKSQALKNQPKPRTTKEPAVIVRGNDLGSAEICNTTAYNRAMRTIQSLDARYFMKPSFLAEPISVPQICALCQEPAGYEGLGILCGPYYIRITTIYEAGLRFHVRCVATAPELEHDGHFITGIQEYLPTYWGQNCCICNCVGASICCSGCGQKYHFPCAYDSGSYDFENCVYTCDSCYHLKNVPQKC
uniref:PHD-type domain-containing protein n=1 Tax=Trichuris muris TaxID=70415 RepID=A0A5S6QN56_TRIMR